ncbi:MAG: T9SS type A sorting domain-containing protein [Flavobacteriales bacterium]|nr:T9SS type A sorting domain-containing protein [Flavobacteriales bacterium]MCB9193120.1 T9SS type A sorting domain-containing protein [Flavobacteriales bacterium]
MHRICCYSLLLLITYLLPGTLPAQDLGCGTRWPLASPYPVVSPTTSTARDTASCVIPVVFHILHDGAIGDISDVQLFDGLDHLNADYGMQAGDTLAVFPGDTVVTADMGVQFCLATVDPNGDPTTGIVRYDTSLTYTGRDPAAKLDPWPREHYLNVWVVYQIDTIMGYALYPDVADTLPLEDGVVILETHIGVIGTSSEFHRHALTHLVGHYLGLFHPWDIPIGSGNCGDDLVDDTPITTPDILCQDNVADCDPPTIEWLPNFMELNYCQHMFTEGQKTRVVATLNSTTAQRNELWAQTNLGSTGVCGYVGVKEVKDVRMLRAHPNPFTDEVIVEDCPSGQVVIEVLSIDGRLQVRKTTRTRTGLVQLDLHEVTDPGMYLLKVSGREGTWVTPLIRQ